MVKTLQEMRAKLKEQEDKKKSYGDNKKGGDKSYYAFWNIPENSTATVRLLPDKGENDWFWVDKAMIRMPFPSILGQPDSKPFYVQVPCIEMYGKKCPVMQDIKDLNWWKGSEEEKALAKTYYRKLSHIYQAFVVTSPLKEENLSENPIRKLMINKSIHEMIKLAIMDPEIEHSVISYDNGTDLKISKTKKGDYADYATSQFSRRSRPLTADELSAIDTFGLFDLKDSLPKEPSESDLKLIMEMFEASVSNEAFDAEKYKMYAPKVYDRDGKTTETSEETSSDAETSGNDTAKAVTEAKAEPSVVKLKPTSEETSAGTPPKRSPQDILEMIKKNKTKQA